MGLVCRSQLWTDQLMRYMEMIKEMSVKAKHISFVWVFSCNEIIELSYGQ